jgi:hypothetical protein
MLQVQVKCLPDTYTSDAIVAFKDEWRGALLNLKQGQTVFFEARLVDYNRFIGLTLRDGKLIQ